MNATSPENYGNRHAHTPGGHAGGHSHGNTRANRGYDDVPTYTCCYYNEQDPRSCPSAKKAGDCGCAQPTPNLGTSGGKLICAGLVMIPVTLFIVSRLMGGGEEEDKTGNGRDGDRLVRSLRGLSDMVMPWE